MIDTFAIEVLRHMYFETNLETNVIIEYNSYHI